jgi:hypothetical protein
MANSAVYVLLFRGHEIRVFDSIVDSGAHAFVPTVGANGTVVFCKNIKAEDIATDRKHQRNILAKSMEINRTFEEIKTIIHGNN